MYIYNNNLCELVYPIRESFFNLIKQINPNKVVKIKIKETGKIKKVKISELEDYIIYRNMFSLGLL